MFKCENIRFIPIDRFDITSLGEKELKNDTVNVRELFNLLNGDEYIGLQFTNMGNDNGVTVSAMLNAEIEPPYGYDRSYVFDVNTNLIDTYLNRKIVISFKESDLSKCKVSVLSDTSDPSGLRDTVDIHTAEIAKLQSEIMTRYIVRLVKNGDTYSVTDLDGENITFADLMTAVRDTTKYVVCVYGNSKLRPQYVGASEIVFTGLSRDASGADTLRMIVRPSGVQFDIYALASEGEVTSLKESIAKLEEEDSRISESVVNIQSDVSELTDRLDNISEVIVETVKPLQKQVDRNEDKLDALWKLSEGQVYDFVNKEETGTATPPGGSKYMSVEDVRGKTEQISTNGYNLFDPTEQSRTVKGITFTRNADNTYTFIGTSTDALTVNFGSLNFEEGKTYKLIGMPVAGVQDKFTLFINNIGGLYPNDLGNGIVFTAPTSKKCDVLITMPSGTVTNFVVKPMVTTNTSLTYADYEPYTGGMPSPSPSFPQSIQSVENILVRKTGANLWDEEWEVGAINIETGINVNVSTGIRTKNYIPVIAGAKYYIGLVGEDSGNNIKGRLYDRDKNYISTITPKYNSVFTIPNNVAYLRFSPQDSYGIVYKNNIILALSDIAVPYEPYHEETRTITPPKPINKIGDYTDVCNVDGGVWEYVNKVRTFDDFAPYTYDATGKLWVSHGVDKTWVKNVPVQSETVPYVKALYMSEIMGTSTNDDYIWVNNGSDTIVPNGKIIYSVNESVKIPIAEEDLDFLRSLELVPTTDNIFITDQNGNDVSFMVEYIRKLSEVTT